MKPGRRLRKQIKQVCKSFRTGNSMLSKIRNRTSKIRLAVLYTTSSSVSFHLSDAVERCMFSSFSLDSQKAKSYLKVKSVKTEIFREQPDFRSRSGSL